MRKWFAVVSIMILLTASLVAAQRNEKEMERLENAGRVLSEILEAPDNIPHNLIDGAECVVVYPSVVEGAFIVGGQFGRGAMVCRTGQNNMGPWGSPVMMALEGGSVGFQIGGQATDLVLLVMNKRGADSILSSKVKLGADASIAAGPKGRTVEAATDASFRAEILSYSRSRGAFAGISLEGSTVRPDGDANSDLYGKNVDPKDVAVGKVQGVPNRLTQVLQKVSPKNLSDVDSDAKKNPN